MPPLMPCYYFAADAAAELICFTPSFRSLLPLLPFSLICLLLRLLPPLLLYLRRSHYAILITLIFADAEAYCLCAGAADISIYLLLLLPTALSRRCAYCHYMPRCCCHFADAMLRKMMMLIFAAADGFSLIRFSPAAPIISPAAATPLYYAADAFAVDIDTRYTPYQLIDAIAASAMLMSAAIYAAALPLAAMLRCRRHFRHAIISLTRHAAFYFDDAFSDCRFR